MQHMEDKVTPEDRLDKACEPGVDYGEEGAGRHMCTALSVSDSVCGCGCVCGCDGRRGGGCEWPWLHVAVLQAMAVGDWCAGGVCVCVRGHGCVGNHDYDWARYVQECEKRWL